MNLHADHDSNRVFEREGEEEVGFGEFTSKDENPETDRGETLFNREVRIGSGEGLRCEVLARFTRNSISEETTRWNDGEEYDAGDCETELDDSYDESGGRGLVESDDVNCRSKSDGETDEKGDHSTKEMRCVVPGCRYVRVFGSGSEDLDEGSDCSSESDDRPLNGSMRFGLTRCGVDIRYVVSL